MRTPLITLAGLLALLYLLNPTFGVFEFLPDNVPLIGNVDEALATAVLLGALRYHGVDLTRSFPGRRTMPFGQRRRATAAPGEAR
jgi:hypothetical protein